MSAWPEKNNCLLNDEYDGYNIAHTKCSQAAIEMLEWLKFPTRKDMFICIDNVNQLMDEQDFKINALIETIRGKM